MESKPCPKCDSVKSYITVDKRGVPEVRCADCDSYITKTSAGTMYEYFMERINSIYAEQDAKSEQPDRPLCRYCTERWAILDGRMGIRPREMNDIKFCPMCGRKLLATDKDY